MYENVRISDQHWKDSLGSLTFKENKCHGLIESIGICFAHVFCKACWNEANSADFGSTKAKYTPTTSSKNQGKIRQLLSHKKKFIRKLEHLPRAFRSEAGAEGSLLQIRNLQLGLSQKKLPGFVLFLVVGQNRWFPSLYIISREVKIHLNTRFVMICDELCVKQEEIGQVQTDQTMRLDRLTWIRLQYVKTEQIEKNGI